jgi:hypothetical protein
MMKKEKTPSRNTTLTALALTVAAILAIAKAAHATDFTFTSKLDKFTVEVEDGSATYNGQEVNAEPFVLVKPLFDVQLEEPCDAGMGKPDLTITRKGETSEEKRQVYIEKQMISDGKNCAAVTGQGIYQLPLHHSWFEAKKEVSIAVGQSFSIWKDDKLVVEFEKTDRGWRNKDPQFFTNWVFFEKFLTVLKNFKIDFRVHPAAAKAFTHFELRQGGRKFSFVKVSEKTWAVQLPGSPWMAASGQFGLFEDMDQKIWISPYAKNLQILKDKTATVEMRIKMAQTLGDSWGPDAKYAFHDILLAKDEVPALKQAIANIMKSHPTEENFKVLIESLRITDDANYRYAATKVLRLRNPKVPSILEDDDDAEVAKKIKAWEDWGKKL